MGVVDSHPQREDEEIRRKVAKKMSFKAERVSLRIKKTDGLEEIRTPDPRRVKAHFFDVRSESVL